MMLELIDISKSYDESSPVLDGVTLSVSAGDTVAVTGPSGSGKTTLLNIAGGLDLPSSGMVRIAGKDLAELSDSQLASVRNTRVGFVFQLHHLLPQCTALENVMVPAIPAGGEIRDRAADLLERVGLADRMDYMPAKLSGGERQRVAVARALINQPGLILADEPTGSLDGDSSSKLSDLLLDIGCGKDIALVVVTHSEELAERMGERYRLVNGKLEQ
jgi:lipoprotein-releasing system ATP-binding protein